MLEDFLARYTNFELLRFLTCGGVDHGKSTLIGRLLHDADQLYDDQLQAAESDSARFGSTQGPIDFALLLDGLEAERQQGITIDVAYRYFSTRKRKFIIADTPGHAQYTRNMVTGASNCDLAVILVDARSGVVEQTRRHAFIASLLGIRHLVLCINKMDLVAWDEQHFHTIRMSFADFAAKLETVDLEFIPVCATSGDNVVHRSTRMPWYLGRPLLDYLENVHVAGDRNLIDLRFPIQSVIRLNDGSRRLTGSVASGLLRRGDDVLLLPSAVRSRVSALHDGERELQEAFPPMSVSVMLDADVDAGRGDLLVHPQNIGTATHDIEAMLVWMIEENLEVGREYILKHTTNQVSAVVREVRYRIGVSDLHREQASSLGLNEIGRVRVEVARRLTIDAYSRNRIMGSFILIDRLTNETVAAGVIMERGINNETLTGRASIDTAQEITPRDRARRVRQEPVMVAVADPNASSSVIALLERILFGHGFLVAAPSSLEERQGPSDLVNLLLENGFVVLARIAPKQIDGIRRLAALETFPAVVVEIADGGSEQVRRVRHDHWDHFIVSRHERPDVTLAEAIVELLTERGILRKT